MTEIENMILTSFPSKPIKNIVLVGRTGNGKSATGNSLIGKSAFLSETHSVGVTMKCKAYISVTPGGSMINIIDTPGLFDLSMSAEYLSKEIINCLLLAEEGLHAVVLVLSVRTRISEEEKSTLQTLQVIFGSKIVDYLIVLFTGGDELEAGSKTLDDYLSKGCPEFLKTVLRLCGGRRILFDNKTTDEGKRVKQVENLIAHVEAIGNSNGGNPFTDEMHRKIKREAELLREQQKKLESRNLADAEKEELMKQLKTEHEQNLKMMATMLENTLKEASASQERMMLALRENLENAHKLQGNKSDEYLQKEPQNKSRPLINIELHPFPEIPKCNIL